MKTVFTLSSTRATWYLIASVELLLLSLAKARNL